MFRKNHVWNLKTKISHLIKYLSSFFFVVCMFVFVRWGVARGRSPLPQKKKSLFWGLLFRSAATLSRAILHLEGLVQRLRNRREREFAEVSPPGAIIWYNQLQNLGQSLLVFYSKLFFRKNFKTFFRPWHHHVARHCGVLYHPRKG